MSLVEKTALQQWLDTEDIELIKVIKNDVRAHVSRLKQQDESFCGYAILPGETYEIKNLVVAYQQESDLEQEGGSDNFDRYCVNQWPHWDHEVFSASNHLIEERNTAFKKLNVVGRSNELYLEQVEMDYIAKLILTIITALRELRDESVFENQDKQVFLTVWFSDSGDEFVCKSVQILNSDAVFHEFDKELGPFG